ncbi:ATP-binding region, ATPase-like:Histidine kinase, HAMP region:Histidine kinase A, N-terminal [Alloactinosynnema sp. L-07]|uniref:sensor histidine kinase n=1 Tax=Alloactinosynnema sp. L-07 TaxID=1653480 RepID=UPI00065F04DB|nr:HAMP domain-containing sensor histidine kinase [Alloactinosynnema sp. L-07]CRK57183.1 ATP-binding region, ATPase-like:Histidine kinase, HAMP region:Histidine kinase A, N-terminal [Alloactinosynnema sp. L-07]
MTRLTIRARLTLVYGGLFLLAGVVLLAATYALVSQQLPIRARGITSELPHDPAAGPQVRIMQVADDLRTDALSALLTQGGIALGVVGIAATAFGWLIAGRLLQPLHRMTETARRIAYTPAPDRGLRERIAMTGPHDEVKELADTFDVMLAALDHSFDGQRRFIANASHELRTPLTINRALLEVAVHRGSGTPEVRQLANTLLEINARHERLIDGLLVLARSERQAGESSFVDLADIVEHVAEQTPAGSVTMRVEAAEAPTTGNPVLLERLVQNLVDNGVRHNVDTGGWVRVVSTTEVDGRALVQVSNTGPVVPPYEIPGLFEPFRRLAGERQATGGAGLGLSIVRAVATAHGGMVYAEPRVGGGLLVTVTLPGAPRWRHVPNGEVAALPAANAVAGQH